MANVSSIKLPNGTAYDIKDNSAVHDASYVHTDNNYTTTEKDKLSGIAAGAEVNVQADWNTTTTTNDSFIKNKPMTVTKTVSGSDTIYDIEFI